MAAGFATCGAAHAHEAEKRGTEAIDPKFVSMTKPAPVRDTQYDTDRLRWREARD